MNEPWPPNRQKLTDPARAPGLSIVIPVYNGAATVGELVEALSALEPQGGLEIVLVNDGSRDNSASVCRALLSTARVPVLYVEHMRNYGEHNAVLTGLRHATGAYVITMDDDLQNPPDEVLRLFDYTRLNGFDVVYTHYAVKAHVAWRNIGSRLANWVADRLLEKPRGIYLSSFRCMSEAAAEAVADYRGPYPYIDGLLMQVTQRIGSLEAKHLPRRHGESNYDLRRLVHLWLNLATSFSLAPLRLAALAGALMALAGAAGAVAVVAEALLVGTPTGWASVAVAMLLIGGLQCLILGVVGEYVGRTFLSANGKPQSAVRDVIASAPAQARRRARLSRAVVSL
jgi:undecaprenyl-phosphate 4-deoxy-4-formamido-L-arabinose transferase